MGVGLSGMIPTSLDETAWSDWLNGLKSIPPFHW